MPPRPVDLFGHLNGMESCASASVSASEGLFDELRESTLRLCWMMTFLNALTSIYFFRGFNEMPLIALVH